jgi:hypothetical protein
VHEITSKGISFQFLLSIRDRLLVVHFQLSFRNSCTLVDFQLTVRDQSFFLETFRLQGIRNPMENLHLAGLAKLVEKLSLRVFGERGQFS